MSGPQASTAKEQRGLMALLFGASAAPIVWLGQVMLAYGVTAYLCYPADHPVMTQHGGALRAALIGFDAIAVLVSLAGGLVAWRCLNRTTASGRVRFLAVWGIFSSLCFLVGIVFNIVASIAVPLCVP